MVKKCLRFIRENNKPSDKEALLSQIKAFNDLILGLSKLAEDKNIEGFKVDEEGEILTALYSKINNIRGIKEGKAIRPVTPLSQSSLFTGTTQEPNMMGEIIRGKFRIKLNFMIKIMLLVVLEYMKSLHDMNKTFTIESIG